MDALGGLFIGLGIAFLGFCIDNCVNNWTRAYFTWKEKEQQP